MDYGAFIRNRREELDLTQKDIAEACNVSISAVSRWESGDIDNMKRDRIAALAKILQVRPTVFIFGDDPTEDQTDHMTILFDAARDAKPEDIQKAAEYLRFLKGQSR